MVSLYGSVNKIMWTPPANQKSSQQTLATLKVTLVQFHARHWFQQNKENCFLRYAEYVPTKKVRSFVSISIRSDAWKVFGPLTHCSMLWMWDTRWWKVWHWKEKKNWLFADYINKFPKRKMEAAGWPGNAKKRKKFYPQSRAQRDFDLDPNMMEITPGRKAIVKSMLNSFWEKFGQNVTQTRSTHEPDKFCDIVLFESHWNSRRLRCDSPTSRNHAKGSRIQKICPLSLLDFFLAFSSRSNFSALPWFVLGSVWNVACGFKSLENSLLAAVQTTDPVKRPALRTAKFVSDFPLPHWRTHLLRESF